MQPCAVVTCCTHDLKSDFKVISLSLLCTILFNCILSVFLSLSLLFGRGAPSLTLLALCWVCPPAEHPLINPAVFLPRLSFHLMQARFLSFSGSQSLSLQCSVNLSNIPCVDSLLIFIVLSRESYWFISCLPACQTPKVTPAQWHAQTFWRAGMKRRAHVLAPKMAL